MALNDLTIHELQEKLRIGETTPTAILQAVFDRIDLVEPVVQAYISLFREEAFHLAAIQDEQAGRGDTGALTGIPIALKDILCTKGWETTCASRILAGFIPPYDATAVEKMRQAGAIFPGKTNMDEFAMGSSTETSSFGITRNPWDTSRIPGGSSGGSAAAVAAGECIAAIGTDTGGSIRQPAALCGVVGMKPTYGVVSRYGMIAFASSLDQIGPLTRDVRDSAIMMNVLAGYDSRDSTSAPRETPDFLSLLGQEITGWTIGIPREYFPAGIDPEVLAAHEKAVATLERLGAKCVEISLPHTPYCVAVYYIIAPAEAASNLARFDGVRFGHRSQAGQDLASMYKTTRSEGFGGEVKRRIMLGTYSLSSGYYDAYYKKASQVRRLIGDDFKAAFANCDALLTPTTPAPAFAIGEKTGDPLQMYLSDIFTIPANLAGIPAISVPCGYSRAGLPLGIQFMVPAFAEERLLQLAYAFERAAKVERPSPPVLGLRP